MNKVNPTITTRTFNPYEKMAGGGFFVSIDSYPLTENQRGIWMAQARFPGSSHFNIGFCARINGVFSVDVLVNAIKVVAADNDALRLVIDVCDGNVPCQRLLNNIDIDIEEIDVSRACHDEASLAELVHEIATRSFSFDGSLLFRNVVLRLGGEDFLWVSCFHHVIVDGIGGMNFYNQVAEVYEGLVKGEDVARARSSFLEYVKEAVSFDNPDRREKDLQYWKGKFVNAPDEVLVPELRASTENCSHGGLVRRSVSRRLVDEATKLCNANGCSFVHFMLAVIASYFFKTEHIYCFSIGSTTHGRNNRALRGVIGMFSSVIPVGVKADDAMSFGDLVRIISNDMRRSYRHQRVPIEEIQRASGVDFGLVDVSFSFDQFPLVSSFGGCESKVLRVYGDKEFGKLAIALSDFHSNDDPFIEYSFNQSCLSESRVVDISLRIEEIMKQAVQGWDRPLGELSMLHEGEFERLVYEFNNTFSKYPKEALIHELFEQQVEQTPEAVAVVYESERLTYAELNAKANQLAHRLRSLTDDDGQPVVKPDALVAISVERSLEMVVGLLGILKAGAAYVPVDPEYPADRIEYMLGDSQARVLVTQKVLLERLPASVQATETVVLLDDDETYAGQPVGDIAKEETGQSSRNLAYVIYTSGSTGLPKGVMVEHRQQDNLLQTVCQAYGLTEQDRVLQFVSMAFDVAAQEIFSTLTAGAALVLRNDTCIGDSMSFWQACRTWGITIMHLPTAFWNRLAYEAPEYLSGGLRLIAVGGERLDPRALSQWFEHHKDRVVVLNEYGPTETAVTATMHAVQLHESIRAPIGRPLANVRVYVLDGQGNPVPMGVSGEIHIGGDGVARGYLNRPELTAEKFVVDPFSEEPGARMYKTGDLGRWRKDGTIEYLGRNDFQVKIRGFRVELGEIEARLSELPAVREVVVLAREDLPGDKRLVAYWTVQEGTEEAEVPTLEQLRDHLKAGLPAYMVPAAFVKLEAMPLTPNGKVDRKALPAPETGAGNESVYESPKGKTEAALAEIWKALLKVDKVGRNDEFFELGGHSLMIMQLVSRIQSTFGVIVSVRNIYEQASLKSMAVFIVKERVRKLDPVAYESMFGSDAIH